MRAVTLPVPGGLDALVLAEVDAPAPGPGEVLVDVVASAVNRADLLQRMGFYDPPPGSSPYPGLECSGLIRALGEGVTGWSVGDPVCALLTGGGYAEQVAVPAGQLLPVPEGISVIDAAALPEAACTVWSNLVQVARLRAGEHLLVHGGTSGIGTHAIQVGKALGATVTVTVGSGEKAARALVLGADRAVRYKDEDFVAAGPYDVVLDNMGASYLERNVAALATGGRLVVIGLQGGVKGELSLGALMAKRATVHGTTLRSRPTGEKAVIVQAVREHVWPLVTTGQVLPVVDRVLPLEQVAEAHRVVEASEHVGKVVLQLR
ncbi:MAG TPA: NAD(P)H-quinone oxidoreductase [Mycobacteriales bacterium]|nr:NAD(P)H-quinone oxidoreductase [Mycobacteriales bacterium]